MEREIQKDLSKIENKSSLDANSDQNYNLLDTDYFQITNESSNINSINSLILNLTQIIKSNKKSKKNKDEKIIITQCPEKNCPLIPSIKYHDFSQTVTTKCRKNHEYHLSLEKFIKINLNKFYSKKYCEFCQKKPYITETNEANLYCYTCSSIICVKCLELHSHKHKVMELNEVNTFCPEHPRKFSGYCYSCNKDLCILCLKEHTGDHHILTKYYEMVPSKDKIDFYWANINIERTKLELLEKLLFENKLIIEDYKEIYSEFFNNMRLKFLFFEMQLNTFDNVKFNSSIIKNVIDLYIDNLVFFSELYEFVSKNIKTETKFKIMTKINDIILKYIDDKKKFNQKKNNFLKFTNLYKINANKIIKFLLATKRGQLIIFIEGEGLYIYDSGSFIELLRIPTETDIVDLAEDASGLLYILKNTMVKIIQFNNDYSNYVLVNKIIFQSFDKVNFINISSNGTIIISRTKKNECILDIWFKKKKNEELNNHNNNNNNNLVQNNIINNNLNNQNQQRLHGRRNLDMLLPFDGINFINNHDNRRLEIRLRRRHRANDQVDNNRNNLIDNINNIENVNNIVHINNNNNVVNNIINNIENNDNNNNINNNDNNNEHNNHENNDNNDNNDNEDNNNDNENDDNENENIFIEQQNNDLILENNDNINERINNINNNINNNNNNNANNNRILLNNNIVNAQDNRRPRFYNAIRFIRNQLQGLVANLEQEELVYTDSPQMTNGIFYGPKDVEVIHINKIVKNNNEIISMIEWDKNNYIAAEFSIQRKNFQLIQIYSSENFEPTNEIIKINLCSKYKNCLMKINNELVGVCFDINRGIFGISLVLFKTKEEITRIILPKYNLARKINFFSQDYLFVALSQESKKNNNNRELIKLFKIKKHEIEENCSYKFDAVLDTLTLYKKDEDKIIKEDSTYKLLDILNSNNQNNHSKNEIISMVKLSDNSFVCAMKSHSINFYKIELS